MFKDKLDELELMVLKKRIDLLTTQGVVARMPFELKQDFLELMGDKWTFGGVLSTIHGMQEMNEPARVDAVAATLPTAKKKRGRKSKAELERLEELAIEEALFPEGHLDFEWRLDDEEQTKLV